MDPLGATALLLMPLVLPAHPDIGNHLLHPTQDLNDVIAPSCYSCFDYPNALADIVVGGLSHAAASVRSIPCQCQKLTRGWVSASHS